MKKPLLYLLSALFLAACAQSPELDNGGGREAPLTSDEAKFLAEAQMPAKFDAQEIDRIVNAIEFPDNNTPGTRSPKRTVTKITPLTGRLSDTATRSGDGSSEEIGEEELFYAVDFGNDDGFAVISADRRLPDEVIINVGSGRFPEGEIENPGFALMMVGAENYARREIAKYEAWRDSMEVVLARTDSATRGVTGPDGPHTDLPPGTILLSHTPTYESPWITDNSSRIAPMVPVEWGQGGPYTSLNYVFNRSVEASFSQSYIDEVHACQDANTWERYIPAGCVPIATVQLMMYWEKSNRNYHERTITPNDWDNLRAYPTSLSMHNAHVNIQQLCSDLILWVGQDIGTTYRPAYEGGSSAYDKDAINLLSRLGYRGTSSGQSYGYTSAKNSLDAGRPVYISGRDGEDDGHAWLIDGALNQTREVTYTTVYQLPAGYPDRIRTYITTVTNTSSYLHNNFGWQGTDNGYYIAGMFDTNNDPDLPSNTRSGQDNNYEFDLKMWPNIYK